MSYILQNNISPFCNKCVCSNCVWVCVCVGVCVGGGGGGGRPPPVGVCICSKYVNKDGNIFTEEESIGILKILSPINNIEQYQKI